MLCRIIVASNKPSSFRNWLRAHSIVVYSSRNSSWGWKAIQIVQSFPVGSVPGAFLTLIKVIACVEQKTVWFVQNSTFIGLRGERFSLNPKEEVTTVWALTQHTRRQVAVVLSGDPYNFCLCTRRTCGCTMSVLARVWEWRVNTRQRPRLWDHLSSARTETRRPSSPLSLWCDGAACTHQCIRVRCNR